MRDALKLGRDRLDECILLAKALVKKRVAFA